MYGRKAKQAYEIDEEEDIDPDNVPEADLESCNIELMNASGSILKSKANICNIKHYFARKDDKNCEVVSYNEELNAQENHLNVSKLLNTIIGEENKNYDADFKRIKILNDETKMVELGSHRENIMPSNPNISAVIDKVGLLIEKDNELTVETIIFLPSGLLVMEIVSSDV
ncbi:unnamed protein product [Gordionus sp. m RMFG-2023]